MGEQRRGEIKVPALCKQLITMLAGPSPVPYYCSLSCLLTNSFLPVFCVTLFSVLCLAEIGLSNKFQARLAGK